MRNLRNFCVQSVAKIDQKCWVNEIVKYESLKILFVGSGLTLHCDCNAENQSIFPLLLVTLVKGLTGRETLEDLNQLAGVCFLRNIFKFPNYFEEYLKRGTQRIYIYTPVFAPITLALAILILKKKHRPK